MRSEKAMMKKGGPYAVKTKFEWTLNGPMGRYGQNGKQCHCHYIRTSQSENLISKQLDPFSNFEFNESLEDLKTGMPQEDKKALSVFEESVHLKDGHYEVEIPWNNYPPCLPDNRPVAEHRLELLKKKLTRNPDMCDKYSNFICDLVDKGYARKVPRNHSNQNSNDDVVWYLPHHSVTHPKKPEKARVVFDCAAKYQATSLNDQTLQGPDLTNSLTGVLIRFREEQIALMADIEAMFHQVRVALKDVNALRFLWFPQNDLNQEPEEFQDAGTIVWWKMVPKCFKFWFAKNSR